MKLRYYMRGLGIGVIVTAILMGIALGGDKEKLTDAEIMARARELGMVESSVLADLGKDKEQQEVPDAPALQEDTSEEEDSNAGETVNEGSQTDQQTEESQPADEGEPTKEVEDTDTEESKQGEQIEEDAKQEEESQTEESETQEPETQEPQTEEYVTLVIERGESSVSVSKSLAELGLVESAKEYDKFLCANGYDKYIRVGTHKIKVGSTDEEIAETISRKKK
ncbi:MAG: hypothetical protein IJW63_06230 [Lachnospiraceae bacterium]|nr:hypothetical protein [Lachnospiraceae bacterium]